MFYLKNKPVIVSNIGSGKTQHVRQMVEENLKNRKPDKIHILYLCMEPETLFDNNPQVKETVIPYMGFDSFDAILKDLQGPEEPYDLVILDEMGRFFEHFQVGPERVESLANRHFSSLILVGQYDPDAIESLIGKGYTLHAGKLHPEELQHLQLCVSPLSKLKMKMTPGFASTPFQFHSVQLR